MSEPLWQPSAERVERATITRFARKLGLPEEYGELWRASDKVVYSTTLGSVRSARTRIECAFEPDAVRRMKDELVGDISIGGPTLAAQAIAAGLIDEYELFFVPVVVGGGTRCLPEGVRLDLQLVDQRRFENGTVYASYCPVG